MNQFVDFPAGRTFTARITAAAMFTIEIAVICQSKRQGAATLILIEKESVGDTTGISHRHEGFLDFVVAWYVSKSHYLQFRK